VRNTDGANKSGNNDFVLKHVSCSCQVGKELALKMYSNMVTLQIMDTIFYEAQRQGRISFYITSNGEEAINIASAAALSADDIVLPQVNFS
jgi:TPP-dependent pyruvate/acetoin dehydrogenase alpha subunit